MLPSKIRRITREERVALQLDKENQMSDFSEIPYDKPLPKLKAKPLLENHFKLERIRFKIITGVYFLYKNNILMYVGKSENVMYRIGQHSNNPKKEFDSYSILECEFKNLNRLELLYIKQYKPEYNIAGKKNKKLKKVNRNYNNNSGMLS